MHLHSPVCPPAVPPLAGPTAPTRCLKRSPAPAAGGSACGAAQARAAAARAASRRCSWRLSGARLCRRRARRLLAGRHWSPGVWGLDAVSAAVPGEGGCRLPWFGGLKTCRPQLDGQVVPSTSGALLAGCTAASLMWRWSGRWGPSPSRTGWAGRWCCRCAAGLQDAWLVTVLGSRGMAWLKHNSEEDCTFKTTAQTLVHRKPRLARLDDRAFCCLLCHSCFTVHQRSGQRRRVLDRRQWARDDAPHQVWHGTASKWCGCCMN